MSGWGNIDQVEDMPIWACSTANMENSTVNANKLYKNETLSDVVDGITVGVSGITAEEVSSGNGSHTGWVKKTEGSGGRSGRIINEVLVAMSEMAEPSNDEENGAGTQDPNEQNTNEETPEQEP